MKFTKHTQLADAQPKHLILPRKRLRLCLVKRRFVVAAHTAASAVDSACREAKRVRIDVQT